MKQRDDGKQPPAQVNGVLLGTAITVGMVGWRIGEKVGDLLGGEPGKWVGAILLGMMAAVTTAAVFQAISRKRG